MCRAIPFLWSLDVRATSLDAEQRCWVDERTATVFFFCVQKQLCAVCGNLEVEKVVQMVRGYISWYAHKYVLNPALLYSSESVTAWIQATAGKFSPTDKFVHVAFLNF